MKLNYMHMEIGEDNLPCLVKEESSYQVDGRYSYNQPDKVSKVPFALGHHKRAEEYFWCMCLNAANHCIGIFEISHGTISGSMASTREIFQRALMCGASSIIVWHNHPSGNTQPSRDDLMTTKKIVEAGKLMNIGLLDHLILMPDKNYISLREAGYIVN